MTNPDRPTPPRRRSTPRPAGAREPARRAPAPPAAKAAPPSRRGWRERLAVLNTHAALVAVTAGVIATVLALLVYGYWDTYIRPARETALRVGDRSYNMTYFTQRLRQQLSSAGGALLQPAQASSVIEGLPDDIITEETALQRAGTLDVAVSDDDIDKELATRVRAVINTDDSGRVVRSPNLEAAVRQTLRDSGLTLAQFRRAVHGQLLVREIRKHFEDAIPDALPVARVSLITVSDEAKANDLKQQLDKGADFAQLAASSSNDASKSQGGLKDWAPKGSYPAPLEDVIYSLPPGQVSNPVKADEKWYILRVEERSDNREVTKDQKSSIAQRQESDWLVDQSKQLHAKSYMDDSDRRRYAIENSGVLQQIQNQSAPGGGQTAPISVPPAGAPPQPGGTP